MSDERLEQLASGMRLEIDARALERFLAERLPGFRGPLTLRRFESGQSNPTYLVSTPGGAFVLRRKPPGPLLPKAHMIEREYRVMAALADVGFPVPRMRLFCDDPAVIGSAFYVMDFVDGRVLFDTTLPGLTPAGRRATYEAIIDTLAALHRIDPAAAGLADFGRPGGYLSRQTRIWSDQYRATETETIGDMDRLIDWLPGAVAAIPDETVLVHGDYRLDNVILDPARPAVIAVLDWELATLGHPLADLGYFLMTWSFPQDLRHGLADVDRAALGIPDRETLAARYGAATGRGAIPKMDLLLAYNAFRMAAIIQGVYHRGLQGNAASDQALSMGADVARLAGIAIDHARRAGY